MWQRPRQWSTPYPSRSKPRVPAHLSEDWSPENVALPFVKAISLCCGLTALIKQQVLSPIYPAIQVRQRQSNRRCHEKRWLAHSTIGYCPQRLSAVITNECLRPYRLDARSQHHHWVRNYKEVNINMTFVLPPCSVQAVNTIVLVVINLAQTT